MSDSTNSPLALFWLMLSGLVSIALFLIGLQWTDQPMGLVLIVGAGVGFAGVLLSIMIHQAWIAPLIVLGLSAGILLSLGLQATELISGSVLVAAGTLGFTLVICTALLLTARSTTADDPGHVRDDIRSLLMKIHEQSMLSDTARRVLYRERELALLRTTIEEDLARGDYNAALVLCQDMESLFGYNKEAQTARDRVLERRNQALAEEIQRQANSVHTLVQEGRWRAAEDAASRLHRIYPDSPQLEQLEAAIRDAFATRKQALRDELASAQDEDDIERAMEILRELDHHLRGDEAQAMHAQAQAVILKHRALISGRFREAVSRKDWTEAIACGERIIEAYPMATMATEVSEMMDRLHERALGESAPVES